ncbi:MAG: polysaccharide export protein [Proteobacteria bacterium]|nr:polysaccharide export protein [Pseudomonadota bacterium]
MMIRQKRVLILCAIIFFVSMTCASSSELENERINKSTDRIKKYETILNISPEKKVPAVKRKVNLKSVHPEHKAADSQSGLKNAVPVESSNTTDPLRLKYQDAFHLKKEDTKTSDEIDTLADKYRRALSTEAPESSTDTGFHEANPDIDSHVKIPESDESQYIIGAGDILDISVWKDASLSRVVTVLPDGIIAIPLAGEIIAAGKKVNELKDELTKRLSYYIPDPLVSISVHQVNSMMIYVIGKVNSPGRFFLNNTINVLQALSMAGGLNVFAKGDKIKIFRDNTTFYFKYKEVSEGINLSQNIFLQRGDVIVIP